MARTAAIAYAPGDWTVAERPMGRRVAGDAFIRALARHGQAEDLFCLAPAAEAFARFTAQVEAAEGPPRRLSWLPSGDLTALEAPGAVQLPGMRLEPYVWRRRHDDQRAYSVIGLVHNASTAEAMAGAGALLTAPVQPWDSLICTSTAARDALEELLVGHRDYLEHRLGATMTQPRLDLIPLGVDVGAFPQDRRRQDLRDGARAQLGIAAADVVVLALGRWVFYTKAHPVPLALAVEQAAAEGAAKVHVLHVGWAEDERGGRGHEEAMRRFAPSVRHVLLDGDKAEVRDAAWSAADVFVSLADSVQETFGLTPLEAMAAGLPCVVSDWDGYRDTVRDGVDGFLVATTLAAAGAGRELALGHPDGGLNYGEYLGHIGAATAVDVAAAAAALSRLFGDPGLRARMGDSGRRRARDAFGWAGVIAAHEALWDELADVRAHALQTAALEPGRPADPSRPDPFALFAGYASRSLSADTLLGLGPSAAPDVLDALRSDWTASWAHPALLPYSVVDALLRDVGAGMAPVAAVLDAYGGDDEADRRRAQRTLVHLLKMDVLRVR